MRLSEPLINGGRWRQFVLLEFARLAAGSQHVLQRQPLALEVHGAAAVGEAGVVGYVVVDASAAMRHGRVGVVHGRFGAGMGSELSHSRAVVGWAGGNTHPVKIVCNCP